MKSSRTLSRRRFLEMAGAAALAAHPTPAHASARKPNLLFIWTDEQRADTMSVYGNDLIQTPHLNRLAGESVVFQNAYVSQPVCTPSRATVMTGLWPQQHRCPANNIPLPQEVRCVPELLNDPDYHTAYMGKWHLGDEIFPQHGFQEWVSIEDGYRPHYGPGRDRRQKSSYAQFLDELGYHPDQEDCVYSRGFASRLPIKHCKPKFLEHRAIDFMRRNRRRPFMLYVNFLEPHMPFNGPLNDLHDPQAIPLPPSFDDPLEDDEPLRYRLLRQNYIDKGFGGVDLHNEAGWRRLRANYYGLVSQVDRSVGGILAELERLGLADNTIVVYTSDHGDMMGCHKLLAKTVMYEESVKVPWLMRIPGMNRKQTLMAGRYSHIDMAPTLLDLMGGRADLPGRTLMPVIQGRETLRRDVSIQWNGSEGELKASLTGVSESDLRRVVDAPIRTVITQDGWKLCHCDRDKHQLFDLNTDPYEMRNLYYQQGYGDRIKDLSQRLQT